MSLKQRLMMQVRQICVRIANVTLNTKAKNAHTS